jgi:hypothetical protein
LSGLRRKPTQIEIEKSQKLSKAQDVEELKKLTKLMSFKAHLNQALELLKALRV